MPKKLTQNDFIKRSNLIHKNKYDYSLSIYKLTFGKVKIICPFHGVFEQEAHGHMSGKGCNLCSTEQKIKRFKNKKLTKEYFIKKSSDIHNNKYSYNLVKILNSDKKVKIICKEHGVFEQTPHNHMSGSGCLKCGYEKVSKSLSTNKHDFLDACYKMHGNKYDCSLAQYKNQNTKLKIVCQKHGIFIKNARSFISGSGCPKCEKCYKITYDIFVAKAIDKHGNKYTYPKFDNIKNNRDKIKIICTKHGEFTQSVFSHLQGSGCQKCGISISKPEEQWLDFNKIPNDKNHRHLTLKINGRNILVDGFIPETNTVYEFYGDFWHGNPKKYKPNEKNHVTKNTFEYLYNKTMNREEAIKSKYNLVSIWESEWKKLKC